MVGGLVLDSPVSVVVCGGGNGAHATAGYLASKGFEVSVLTRRPEDWSKTITVTTAKSTWESKGDFVGTLKATSNKPEDVVPQAQVVLVAAPANAHPAILEKIAPHVRKGAYVGTIFAQGGFDWAAKSAFKGDFSGINSLFGLLHIPWLCRVSQYGREVQIIGPKDKLLVAASPSSTSSACAELTTKLFDIPTEVVPNFLTLTLTPSNQIIHPARYYAIFKDWDGKTPYTKEQISWGLYSEFDALASEWLARLDNELQTIKEGLQRRYPKLNLDHIYPIKERIEKQYGAAVTDTSSLLSVFRTNKSYAGCVTPSKKVEGGFVPAVESRLFWEDIPYGLCILRGIAEMIDIPTPATDFMIVWHQQYMGKDFLVNGKLNKELIPLTGAPQAYGICRLDDLVATSL